MKKLPRHVEQKLYDTIYGKVKLEDFEQWVYSDKEIESILSDEDYLELISFPYKKNGSKYELVHLLTKKYVDMGEYEKWKMLNLLYTAKNRDEMLPYILRQFYDLYCSGYTFLTDLGLGYGLSVKVPPSNNYHAESWEEMSETEKSELLASFDPHLQSDIERAINWIENEKILFSGKTNEIGHYEYEDLRTEKERLLTVWTEVGRNNKTGWSAKERNLKVSKEEKRLITQVKKAVTCFLAMFQYKLPKSKT